MVRLVFYFRILKDLDNEHTCPLTGLILHVTLGARGGQEKRREGQRRAGGDKARQGKGRRRRRTRGERRGGGRGENTREDKDRRRTREEKRDCGKKKIRRRRRQERVCGAR